MGINYLLLLELFFKAKVLTPIIGTYECKIDDKGRLLIPLALKKQLAINDGFVLKRSVFQPCLELYPMAEWNAMMAKVNKLNRFVKKHDDFIRRFSAGVRLTDIDVNGRLLIPKDLQGIAQVKKDIVLSSAINIIEIWDKDTYEKVIADTAVNFADLAEDVMGNLNDGSDGLS